MFLAKEYRGKGLGSKMLQLFINKAKELGYKIMRLDVCNPATQVDAIHLYKKMGFCEIPAYKKSVAQLYMEKKL